MKGKLDEQKQRNAVLAYLCGVSEGYIKHEFGVSAGAIRGSILPNYKEDPLVKFYEKNSPKNRLKNALHLYLIFKRTLGPLGRAYKKVHKKSYPLEENFDYSRDYAVCEAVDNDIFRPVIEKLVKVNKLERILGSELPHEKKARKERKLSPQQRFLTAIFEGRVISDYDRAVMEIKPLLLDCMEELYNQNNGIQINNLYLNIENYIYGQIRFSLKLARDERIRKYYESLKQKALVSIQEAIVKKHLSKQIEGLLEDLSPRREKILRMRYGIYGIREDVTISRKRIRQIEKKFLKTTKSQKKSKNCCE